MHYLTKELHKLITILSNEEGLSKHGATLIEGYAVGLDDELVNSSDVIPNVSVSLLTTKIIREKNDLVGFIDLVDCCKRGPITDEKYCPYCGKKIERQ